MVVGLRGTNTWRLRPIRQGAVCWCSSKPGGYAESNTMGGGSKTFAQLFPGSALANYRAQGFDNIRLMFDIDTYEAGNAGTRATYLSTFNTNLTTLLSNDISVLICPAGFSTFPGDFWDGVAGATFLKFKSHWQAIAASVASLNRSDMIAYELYNEPYTVAQATLDPHLIALNAAIRQYDDRSSIFTVSTGFQDISNVSTLSGTLFTDARVGVAFHHYPIGAQAGISGNDYHKGFGGWVFPVGNSNKTAALAVADAVADALGSTAGQRNTVKNNEVTPYYDTPKDQAYYNGQMTTINTWASGLSLTANRIIMSEGGATGDSATQSVTFDGSLRKGLSYANRKNAYGMIKTALNTRSYGGIWQQLFYVEDGGVSQGLMTDNTNFTYDSGIIDALKNGTVV